MIGLEKKILPVIKAALREDIGKGDITSNLIIPARQKVKAVIITKENGIACGLKVAQLVFKTTDKNIRFQAKTADGKRVKAGQVLARLAGNARSILAAERTALNFLGRLSGIATLTSRFVQQVKPYRVKIMDTRKTTPGLRILEKYAVRCGGGFNHRMDLGEQVLVKDNHLSVVSRSSLVVSLKELIKEVKKKKQKKIKIEVEVKSLNEFREALAASPDIIMLDNFNLKNIKKAVKIRNDQPFDFAQDRRPTTNPATSLRTGDQRPKIEVSGGVTLENVRRIAACGIEMISVGALTHSAKAQDLALNCE